LRERVMIYAIKVPREGSKRDACRQTDKQEDFVGYFLSRRDVTDDSQSDGIDDPTVTVVKLFEGLFVDVNGITIPIYITTTVRQDWQSVGIPRATDESGGQN
jgi:hypothetical protein